MSGIIYLTLHFLQRFLGVLYHHSRKHLSHDEHLNKSAKFIRTYALSDGKKYERLINKGFNKFLQSKISQSNHDYFA